MDLGQLLEVAQQSVRRNGNGYLLDNHNYPLPEDDMEPLSVFAANAHVFSVPVSLPFKPGPKLGSDLVMALGPELVMSICLEARKRCVSYRSYPTRNLTAHLLMAYTAAVDEGRTECVVTNFCCTQHECPQIQFQREALNALIAASPLISQFKQIGKTMKLFKPESNVDWEPLLSTLSTLDPIAITQAMIPICCEHGVGFQEVEWRIRMSGPRCFLIAGPPIPNTVSEMHGKPQLYALVVSTLFPLQSMSELLEHSKSYAANFQKLAQCGFAFKSPLQ